MKLYLIKDEEKKFSIRADSARDALLKYIEKYYPENAYDRIYYSTYNDAWVFKSVFTREAITATETNTTKKE